MLHNVPITLIGVAISTAAFPKLTERLTQNRPDLFKRDLANLLRLVIWYSLPAILITFLMRGYLARVITGSGNAEIAMLVGVFAWVILFRALYHVLSRSFYAQQDTHTPLYVSIVAIGLNIVLAIWWAAPENLGLIGLPLAQIVASATEAFILTVIMQRRFPGTLDRRFFGALWRMVSAFGITFWATWVLRRQFFELGADDRGFFTLFPKLMLLCMAVALIYFGLSVLFKIEETSPITAKIRDIVFKQIRLQ
jgi:putative peptidoglycan lipid II flippase